VVYADLHRTSQILNNLIGNAIKYSPKGGTVTVTAEEHEGMVRVSVRDEGLGIPEEALHGLFTPFFRADRDARSDIPGTGLGLTIVKNLVEGQGGAVTLESEEGVGTVVSFTLPVSAEAYTLKSPPSPPRPAESGVFWTGS
jgi:signal transduction histidine kinase